MAHISDLVYKNLAKPLLFCFDPEFVHDFMTQTGWFMSRTDIGMSLTSGLFLGNIPKNTITIDNIKIDYPIGLAAGFDYTGKMARIMKAVGFGFNTVGTVTAKQYEGNPKPRMVRLPSSQSLLVNKGFKSPGADKVRETLRQQNLKDHVVGISVGSSNIPEIDTIPKAIDDYLYTINTFKDEAYVTYFEINISCPNARISEQFAKKETLSSLLSAIMDLHITRPLWLKMANEITEAQLEEQVHTALKYGVKTIILSNLVKTRTNAVITSREREMVKDIKGNFSGKPTEENSLLLIQKARKIFGKDISIIGLGGIFTPNDAEKRLQAGADAIQLITGMIYNGPGLIGNINRRLGEIR